MLPLSNIIFFDDKMKKLVLCVLLCLSVLTLFSQRSRGLRKFKTYSGKDYLIFGIGPNYMFGDAGGTASDLRLWVNDWDLKYTRPSVTWGYKHEYNDIVANKLVFMYSLFSGNDDESRNERRFLYYANAIEASLQFDIYFFKGRYKRQDFDLYLFFGIGGMAYNTNWKWVENSTGNLYYYDPYSPTVPLPGRLYFSKPDVVPENSRELWNPETEYFEYSGKSLVIPFGIGARFPINRLWSFGGEFGWRYLVGSDADFLDGFYTYWSRMNDSYFNINFNVSYKIAGGDGCYSQYSRKQINWRRKLYLR